MTTNQIKFAELKEAQRHNLETESQGRTKLGQDYEVGTKQASAALSNAAANQINAATRQQELSFAQTRYESTGKALEQATAAKYAKEAQLTDQKYSTEYYNTLKTAGQAESAKAAGQWDKYNYGFDRLVGNTMLTIGGLGKAAK